MPIHVVEDREAEALLERADFVEAWAALVRSEDKLSVNQEHAFVTAWYLQYRDAYTPLFCLGYDGSGALAGVMPLAKDRSSGEVVHAGAHQAEYHGWLCRPELEGSFPVDCLVEIKRRFRPGRWAWNWMPPGSSTDWLASPRLAEEGIHVEVETQDSPVHQLRDDAKLKKMLKNKGTKSKLSHFKKRGGLVLERITDIERARSLMPPLVQQCDLRQEAVNGCMPFADDARKLPFYLDRLRHPEASHFTVLWCEGQPLAFHFGACDRRQVILGLATYDPREGKNSPGTLLIIKLIELLMEEGYEIFDLSPGGDPYKERFANAHRPVAAPTFHCTRRSYWGATVVRRSRRLAKQALVRLKVEEERLQRLRAGTEAFVEAAGQRELGELARRATQLVYDREEQLLYRLPADRLAGGGEPDGEVRVQCFEDLLDLPPGDLPVPRRGLYSAALTFFDRGETLYTALADGSLAQLGWLLVRTGGKPPPLPFELPVGAALLHDLVTLSSAGGPLLERCLRRMLADCVAANVEQVLLLVGSEQRAARQTAEQLGFSLEMSRGHRRVLWWQREW